MSFISVRSDCAGAECAVVPPPFVPLTTERCGCGRYAMNVFVRRFAALVVGQGMWRSVWQAQAGRRQNFDARASNLT